MFGFRTSGALVASFLTALLASSALAGPDPCGIWSLVPTPTAPNPRQGPMTILDPVRDRMVMYGGFYKGGWLGDLWQYSLAPIPGRPLTQRGPRRATWAAAHPPSTTRCGTAC